MEKRKKTKTKIFLVIFIILFIISLCSLGYLYYKYDSLKTDNKEIKEELKETKKKEEIKEKETSNKQEEALITNSQIRFKNITCESDSNTCIKKAITSYNGKNHDIEVKYYQKSEANTSSIDLIYDVTIDGIKIDTINAGNLFNEDLSGTGYNDLMNFDGYIYVFDGKYMGVLYKTQYPAGGAGYKLALYNENRRIGSSIDIDAAGQSFGEAISDGIENIIFDGTTLKYWYMECGHKNAVQLGLTFDGTNTSINVLNRKTGIEGGGSSACYDTNKNTYSGG